MLISKRCKNGNTLRVRGLPVFPDPPFKKSGGLGVFWQHFPRKSLRGEMLPVFPGSPGLFAPRLIKLKISKLGIE